VNLPMPAPEVQAMSTMTETVERPSRRMFLRAGAAATIGGLATAALGSTAGASTPTNVGAAQLQALLDAAGPTCTFPGGVVDLPPDTRLVVRRSVTILGNGTTLRVRGNAVPTRSLIDADGLPDGSRLEIRNLRIEGPSTAGWDPRTESNAAAISWQRYRTWNSTMVVRNVTTTGGYGSGVSRAGGGRLEVLDSDLGGWVDGAAFFESHGGSGSMLLQRTRLTAPTNSKFSSIGLYIHPHLDLVAEDVVGTAWNRWVVYVNGTPKSTGRHRLSRVTATDCALVQTGSGSTTVLDRCVEQGTARNGGTYLKGPVTATGCTWTGTGTIGVLSGQQAHRSFVDNTIRPSGTWMALGSGSAGSISVQGGRAELNGRATLLKLTPGATTQVPVDRTAVAARGTGIPINVEGGRVRVTGVPVPARSRALRPGVLES
jgi:hypothetical protein